MRVITESWMMVAMIRSAPRRLGPLLVADLDRALIVALSINTVPIREDGRRDERGRLTAFYRGGGTAHYWLTSGCLQIPKDSLPPPCQCPVRALTPALS